MIYFYNTFITETKSKGYIDRYNLTKFTKIEKQIQTNIKYNKQFINE